MADAPTVRETLEAAFVHHELACPPRSELKRVTEARAEFRQTVRETLLRGRSLPADDVEKRCRQVVLRFDDALIAKLREGKAVAVRDKDGTDDGMELMPWGKYWDEPQARCVLHTEIGCTSTLCAERRYCQRRNRYSVSDILVPAEVLSPSEVDAPILISRAIADLIAKECLEEGGCEATVGLPHAAQPAFTDKIEAPTATPRHPAGKKRSENFKGEEEAESGANQRVYHTGLPGRPTSWKLISTECRRRYAAGERHPNELTQRESPAEWADVLIPWLQATHPLAPPVKTKTLTNKLPVLFREITATKRPKS